jgi:hypothetical protein
MFDFQTKFLFFLQRRHYGVLALIQISLLCLPAQASAEAEVKAKDEADRRNGGGPAVNHNHFHYTGPQGLQGPPGLGAGLPVARNSGFNPYAGYGGGYPGAAGGYPGAAGGYPGGYPSPYPSAYPGAYPGGYPGAYGGGYPPSPYGGASPYGAVSPYGGYGASPYGNTNLLIRDITVQIFISLGSKRSYKVNNYFKNLFFIFSSFVLNIYFLLF